MNAPTPTIHYTHRNIVDLLAERNSAHASQVTLSIIQGIPGHDGTPDSAEARVVLPHVTMVYNKTQLLFMLANAHSVDSTRVTINLARSIQHGHNDETPSQITAVVQC